MMASYSYIFETRIFCTSNHMFERQIWDKFQKINEINFPPNFTNKHVIPG